MAYSRLHRGRPVRPAPGSPRCRPRRRCAGPFGRTLLDLNYRNFHPPALLTPQYRFAFANDPTGLATSWRGDQGTMVVQPVT